MKLSSNKKDNPYGVRNRHTRANRVTAERVRRRYDYAHVHALCTRRRGYITKTTASCRKEARSCDWRVRIAQLEAGLVNESKFRTRTAADSREQKMTGSYETRARPRAVSPGGFRCLNAVRKSNTTTLSDGYSLATVEDASGK